MQKIIYACMSLFIISASFFENAENSSKNQKKIFHGWQDMGNLAVTMKRQLSQTHAASFLLGASTSEHQCSKQCSADICSWSRFSAENNLAQPTDKKYVIDLWNHYKDYIDFIKNTLHGNTLRFSIEWPLVQPKNQYHFDQDVIDHYKQMFAYAIKQGVTPIVCFHHYTDPCWFIDAGGFEEEKNIDYFVTFCAKMYKALMESVLTNEKETYYYQKLSPRFPLWATFNSPEGYAFKGYYDHTSPPARKKRKSLQWACTVLSNMLEAHVRVYFALKEVHQNFDMSKKIDAPMIGFLKNIYQLDPAQKTVRQKACLPISSMTCAMGHMMQHKSIYRFFKKGIFSISIPGVVHVHNVNRDAMHALDFIGLNYYSNGTVCLTKIMPEKNPQYATDNPQYRIYPEGLYRAIVELSENIALPLNIPLYVTENGIATQDDNKRAYFYHTYLHALAQAACDGYPVYGYVPWTLADNYEWPNRKRQTSRAYGLCTVDENNPQLLKLKQGAQPYATFVHAFMKNK